MSSDGGQEGGQADTDTNYILHMLGNCYFSPTLLQQVISVIRNKEVVSDYSVKPYIKVYILYNVV